MEVARPGDEPMRLRVLGTGKGTSHLPLFKDRQLPQYPERRHSLSTVQTAILMAFAIVVVFLVAPAAAGPVIRSYHHARASGYGSEILQMAFSLQMVATTLAIVSVAIVTAVYAFLIRRGSLMSTTALFPRGPIEANIGELLTLGWSETSEDILNPSVVPAKSPKAGSKTQSLPPDAIRLFYLGKMRSDGHPTRVAKGVLQCAASPEGPRNHSPLWLTSGSPLTKSIVQLLVWEWVSLWLLLLMIAATLMFNGFFTDTLMLDSYPRLTVMLIYATAYILHTCYVWHACSSFLTNVASGAAWSLLERAKFAVGDRKRLHRRTTGKSFEFKSIDKASAEFIPTTFEGLFKHEVDEASIAEENDSITNPTEGDRTEDPKELRAALATVSSAQKMERDAAIDAAGKAFDRVVSNAMVMMSVTLSTGFSAWTSRQVTENSPNNFNTGQIGSLALLASLSLGAATMFTSALNLSIMDSAFHAILSLKEVKINGQAVDHYKKRRSRQVPLSFTSGVVASSRVGFVQILAANSWQNIFGVIFFGPAYALLPKPVDHDRTSAGVEFDFLVKVRDRNVLLTTRKTDMHGRGEDDENIEVINVCYVDPDSSVVEEVESGNEKSKSMDGKINETQKNAFKSV